MPSAPFAAVFGGRIPGQGAGTPVESLETKKDSLRELPDCWSETRFQIVEATTLDARLQQAWSQEITCAQALQLLGQTVSCFQRAQESFLRTVSNKQIRSIRSDLHASFVNALPSDKYTKVLGFVLFSIGAKIIHIPIESSLAVRGVPEDEQDASQLLVSIVKGLSSVGLAGAQAQRAYAHAVDKLLDAWVRTKFGRLEYQDFREDDIPILMESVAQEFAPFMKKFMSLLPTLQREAEHLDEGLMDSAGEGGYDRPHVEIWEQRARDKLAKIRSKQVYDIILGQGETDWAHGQLREFATTPAGRQYLAASFSKQLHRRLLHPGSSTVQVLDMYILVIEAFKVIDPSRVLLHRAAEPIRAFLRARDDAVRIIILSMLEKYREGLVSTDSFCAPVSRVMEESKLDSFSRYYQSMDLLSMSWTPDPVDAAVGHRDAAHLDAISHMITLESKENFMMELQNIFGERILQTSSFQFHAEKQLLELFKDRFEDFQIQHCEVMLRDMSDSSLLNSNIRARSANSSSNPTPSTSAATSPVSLRKSSANNSRAPISESKGRSSTRARNSGVSAKENTEDEMNFDAKVLSHYFWPALKKQSIKLPEKMQHAVDKYSREYCAIRKNRRLKWMNVLGWVTVELELADRTITESVTTWQAAVIYQFDSPSTSSSSAVATAGNGTEGVSKTVKEICSELEMEESMARAALVFWVGKTVLREASPDTYTVIEHSTAARGKTLAGAVSSPRAGVGASLTSSSPSPSSSTSPTTARTKAKARARAQAQQAEQERAAAEAAATAIAMAAAQPTALQSAQDTLQENSKLYASFIIGMLTNQGALPAARILMMLRMLVPGGFPFEQAELLGFLESLKAQGKVERAPGGVWRIVKPQQQQPPPVDAGAASGSGGDAGGEGEG